MFAYACACVTLWRVRVVRILLKIRLNNQVVALGFQEFIRRGMNDTAIITCLLIQQPLHRAPRMESQPSAPGGKSGVWRFSCWDFLS